jgi:lambda family phage portal protein
MGLLDWLRKAAPPRPPERPSEPVPRRRSSRAYDGAGDGYRTDGWDARSTSAKSESGGGLVKLRDRSRDLVRNTAWGRRIVDALVSNIIGTGIRPMLETGSEALDKKALRAWAEWSKSCYPGNRSTAYTMQSMVARSWVESGEVLLRKRPRRQADMPGVVPLQIQVLEADMLDHTMTQGVWSATQGVLAGSVVQGVEFDPLDRRVAYHLHKTHPGDAWLVFGTGFETVRVKAENVVHLYQEARPGQVRGIPWMHAVIPAVWDLAGYADAERVRAKAAACIMAWVQGGDPDTGVPIGVDGIGPAEDSDAPGEVAVTTDGDPIERMMPGFVGYLPDGKTVEVTSPGTAQGYSDYVSASLHEIAAGVGLSYSTLSGDMGDANFAQGKLGQNEQHRLMRAIREQVFCPFVMDPLWSWFVTQAILSGHLPDDERLYGVKWSSPQIESVDPLTDAKAHLAQMRAGTHSRREIISGRGRDPEDVDAEIAADKAARLKMGIILDSDPSQTATSGTIQGGGTDAQDG